MSACVISASHAAPFDRHPALQRALSQLKPATGVVALDSDDDAFEARQVVLDASGSEHVRFDRRHKGLRVIGGDVVVHSSLAGALRSQSRTRQSRLQMDTTARIDEDAARQCLNEATSDIFGTMVEFYAANSEVPGTTPNYLIGERIYASQKTTATPTQALRCMFKPSMPRPARPR